MHSRLVSWSRGAYLAGMVLALVLVVPTAWFPFQLTKISAFAVCAAVAAVLFVMGGGLRELMRARGFTWALLAGVLPLAYLLSALFSTNRSVAWLGSGLEADTVVFAALAFAAFLLSFALFRTQRTVRTFLAVLSGALVLAALFQWISVAFGGAVIPFATFADRSVNLVGKWNDLGLLLGLLSVLTLARVELAAASPLFRGFAAAALAALALLLAIVNFPLVWGLVLALALVIALIKATTRRPSDAAGDGREEPLRRLPVFSGALALVAVAALFFGSTFNAGLTRLFPVSSLEVRPSYESTLSVQAAAREGSFSRLLIGSGPNTFGAQWLAHKPAEVNLSPFWNVDFNVGFSTLTTALGTAGLAGVVAWLIPLLLALAAAVRVMRRSVLSREDRTIAIMLAASAVFLYASLLFYVPSQNLIMLALALAGATFGFLWRQGRESAQAAEQAPSRTGGAARSAFALVFIAVMLVPSGLVARRFFSEVYASRGALALQQGDADAAFNNAARAARFETTPTVLQLAASAGAAKLGALAQNTELPEEELRANFEAALRDTVGAAQQATLVNPGDYRPYLILADVYAFLAGLNVEGAYEGATAAYGEARTRNPMNPGIPLSLARLEASRGNAEGAREQLAESLKLKQNYTDAMLASVQLSVAENDLPAAIRAAEAASQTAPGVAPIWFQLGLLHYAAGDTARAVSPLEQAIALVPDYANAKYFLGLSYYAQGRAQEAIRQFEDLAKTNPDNAEVALILGNLRFGNPPFEGAEPPVTPEPETRPAAPIEE